MYNKLCCPQCGNHELQVINETNVQTTGKDFSAGKGCMGYLLFGPLGILCGSCGQGQKTTSTNATYWVCNKCGKKFRDLEEQRKEASSCNAGGVTFFILGIICALIMLFTLNGNSDSPLFIFLLMMALMFIICGFVFIGKKSSILKEIKALENAIARHSSGNGGGYFDRTALYNRSNDANNRINNVNQNNSYSNVNKNISSNTNSDTWICKNCKVENLAIAKFCGECGTKKPEPETPVSNDWVCNNCNQVNSEDSNFCISCGGKKIHSKYNQTSTYSGWTCTKCGQDNLGSSRHCSNCGNSKPIYTNNKTIASNEWLCPQCGVINQNYVGTCGCGEQKPR